jgi:hypothetical protein
MSELIEMGREYQTRDGREVRIVSVTPPEPNTYPVLGYWSYGGSWSIGTWKADGLATSAGIHNLDLIPVPKKHKRTVWLLHHQGDFCDRVDVFWSHEDAMTCKESKLTRLAITGPHEIEFTEGEGLTP